MFFMSDNTRLLQEPCLAKIDEIVQGRVRIRWNANYWDAYVYIENNRDWLGDISPGKLVTVVGTRGTKLIVLL